MSLIFLILTVPFLLSIFSSGGESIVRLGFEMSIPAIMFIQLVTAIGYFNGVRNINERFKVELINIGKSDLEVKDYSKLLIPILEYYNIKSWANINLDEKIFKKHNVEISQNWINRKKKLG